MTSINNRNSLNNRNSPAKNVSCANAAERKKNNELRWARLCGRHLPVEKDGSIWRFNRRGKPGEPVQGWKLHISATILEACDVLEKVAPLLLAGDVQFKAPNKLDELLKINCGLNYGYSQIGKFITVYPASEDQAVYLAGRLHELTREFVSIAVPFDEQYLPDSSVFYRYGAFAAGRSIDADGVDVSVIENPDGKLVSDDRRQAVPVWMSDPFQTYGKTAGLQTIEPSPLETTYKVFCAVTQRGKGGTYQAIDFGGNRPRFCIVKEGRRFGEIGWDEKDGYLLVKNEFEVLKILRKKYNRVPQVFESFEIDRNFYMALELVAGKSLHDLLKPRRRRFTIGQVLEFGVGIAEIIEKIHQAGWVWNDCKPANLIVDRNKKLRPIDFENAYPIGETEKFNWQTKAFSKSAKDSAAGGGKSVDIYALGAVLYFLLTGIFFETDQPKALNNLRRRIPGRLVKAVEKLLFNKVPDISEIKPELAELLEQNRRQ